MVPYFKFARFPQTKGTFLCEVVRRHLPDAWSWKESSVNSLRIRRVFAVPRAATTNLHFDLIRFGVFLASWQPLLAVPQASLGTVLLTRMWSVRTPCPSLIATWRNLSQNEPLTNKTSYT
jgi:hypothetical protein